MTFDKSQFNPGTYVTYGPDRKFVARFKNSARDRSGFISFLIKNFTVEEYFAALDSGVAPFHILEAKGYVSATVARIIKAHGFPATREGVRAYFKMLEERRVAA